MKTSTRHKLAAIDAHNVKRAYARWEPVYDIVFGEVFAAGRRAAVAMANRRSGRVLEVGVGTGISLPQYKHGLRITGIDLSPQMLRKARERVNRHHLGNVEALLEMDAGAMHFPDNAFDVVAAMFVMPVVPDPGRVMAELERVCRPGGEVLVVNHSSEEGGVRGLLEKALAPAASSLGWRSQFPREAVMVRPGLRLEEVKRIPPVGMVTLLRFVKHA
jgi:phosphatidylethanolamine/phosphatidyl-N-methylethanolamine N-methyltransferase